MDDESGDPGAADDTATSDEATADETGAAEPPRQPVPAGSAARPRIEGVEAAVAAGLVPSFEGEDPPRSIPRHLAADADEEPVPDEPLEAIELPDWTDPPTREVPRVLLREGEPEGPVIPGPVWRESGHDFEQDEEAFAEMVSGTVPIIEHDFATSEDDVDFGALPVSSGPQPVSHTAVAERELFPETGLPPQSPHGGRVSFAGRASRKKEPPPTARARKRDLASKAEPAPRGEAAQKGEPAHRGRKRPSRNPVVATVTGAAVGAIALVCFWLGSVASLAIAALVLFLASAEYFSALRRAHHQPATLLGLVAAPGFAVAGYERGPVGIAVAMAVAIVAVIVWYIVGVTRQAVTTNISVSLFGIGWIAFLGSFAGLLLSPSAFPSRHGVAFLLGAAEVTVAYDVGGYLFGSFLGRHRLAPSLSPRKTWEGLIGGSVSAIVVGLAITARMHPWTLADAAALSLIAAVLAPVGDLAESMVKRDLHVKDMGNLLPAHGGLLDRIDALLFVLPATYVLVRLVHG